MTEKKERFNFPRYEYMCLHPAYIPNAVFVSLEQGGGVSKPLVKPGDSVFEGQTIASGYKTSVPVHAPIPGTVIDITERTMPDGKNAECICIAFKGSFNFEGKNCSANLHWNKQSAHKLISQIRHNGIINTFDTGNASLAWQMEKCSASPVLGVRLFDFDPSCFVDGFISSFFIDEVLQGVLICATAMQAKSVVFFYSASDFVLPDKEKTDAYFNKISYSFIKTDTRFYPSGSERVLQKIVKKTPPVQNAVSSVNLFIDSRTAFSVYKCIVLSMSLTDTIIEVNGQALHESKMLKVKIGTPIRRLLEECGGCEKPPAKIVINGLIKGTAVCDLDIPVTKYVKTITLLAATDLPDQTVSQCIHCGFCRKACPLGIQPDRIYSHYTNKAPLEPDILLSAHLCDNCALCNAACPARLPLYQTVSTYKEKK
ncbi:4Fe-4S dicluster domain-containing protein [Treponema sp. OMZ 840]|uniref:4Fe-4S dicluster domain-containing protein n=1 Tax=Treponema sp. OMZ 840 TaxID=244313 RepID=UPI003D92B171